LAPALATATVALREVDLTVAAEAVIEAVRQSTVSAQVTGRVVDLRFDVGDRVEKGTVIARIDERAASQVAAAAEAQAREAEAAMLNARQNLDRTRQLFSQKFVSQASLDKAETDFRAAEARFKSVLAGAGAAATERSFTTIVAPYSGVVLTRHVQLGEMASPGKPLLTGFDPSSLRAVATVPTGQTAAISAGAKARVEVPALGRWIEARAVQFCPLPTRARKPRKFALSCRRTSRALRPACLRERTSPPARLHA
jgi:RND family efflux transporter MFP subunit